jgi:glycine cleavage system H protein
MATLPSSASRITHRTSLATLEIFTPISGKVAEVNQSLADEPEKVNKDPYGEGWMIKMKMSKSGEVDSLLTAAEYEDFTKAESE